jgi:hypothetical protein
MFYHLYVAFDLAELDYFSIQKQYMMEYVFYNIGGRTIKTRQIHLERAGLAFAAAAASFAASFAAASAAASADSNPLQFGGSSAAAGEVAAGEVAKSTMKFNCGNGIEVGRRNASFYSCVVTGMFATDKFIQESHHRGDLGRRLTDVRRGDPWKQKLEDLLSAIRATSGNDTDEPPDEPPTPDDIWKVAQIIGMSIIVHDGNQNNEQNVDTWYRHSDTEYDRTQPVIRLLFDGSRYHLLLEPVERPKPDTKPAETRTPEAKKDRHKPAAKQERQPPAAKKPVADDGLCQSKNRCGNIGCPRTHPPTCWLNNELIDNKRGLGCPTQDCTMIHRGPHRIPNCVKPMCESAMCEDTHPFFRLIRIRENPTTRDTCFKCMDCIAACCPLLHPPSCWFVNRGQLCLDKYCAYRHNIGQGLRPVIPNCPNGQCLDPNCGMTHHPKQDKKRLAPVAAIPRPIDQECERIYSEQYPLADSPPGSAEMDVVRTISKIVHKKSKGMDRSDTAAAAAEPAAVSAEPVPCVRVSVRGRGLPCPRFQNFQMTHHFKYRSQQRVVFVRDVVRRLTEDNYCGYSYVIGDQLGVYVTMYFKYTNEAGEEVTIVCSWPKDTENGKGVIVLKTTIKEK